MTFLLDTNVVSELRKPAPAETVAAWFGTVSADELYLSVLVLGEIRQGIDRLRPRDSAQAGVYERWLGGLTRNYADRLLPVSAEVAEVWGRLNARDPLPVVDGLMTATAIVHDLTFVTRDESRLATTGVSLLNPWR